MGALLSLPLTLLNALLPFTNPKTPLLQDLIHTAILCGTLYFAPQLAESYNNAQNHAHHQPSEPIDAPLPPEDIQEDATPGSQDDIPLAEDLVLQPDTDAEDNDPPPHAPTPPPPNLLQHAQPPPPLFDHHNHQFPLDNDFAADPGPVNHAAQGPRPTPANRTIGTKKAKSLARKDQRRAYHEFHRQEAELRRLREAEGAEERDAALAAEKARRAEVEREILEREREAREKKKEEERRELEEERERRERVLKKVKDGVRKVGAVDLGELASAEGKDRVWGERLVRASGILQQVGGVLGVSEGEGEGAVVLTGSGWVVKVDRELMRQAYAEAVAFGDRNGGKVGFEAFGGILEKAVRARVEA